MENNRIYIMNNFAIHLKLTQYYKLKTLPFKKIKSFISSILDLTFSLSSRQPLPLYQSVYNT